MERVPARVKNSISNDAGKDEKHPTPWRNFRKLGTVGMYCVRKRKREMS